MVLFWLDFIELTMAAKQQAELDSVAGSSTKTHTSNDLKRKLKEDELVENEENQGPLPIAKLEAS